MQSYWEKIEDKDNLERGLFLIRPLQYADKVKFHRMFEKQISQ